MTSLPSQFQDYRAILAVLPDDWRDVIREFGLVSSHRDAKIEEPEELMQLLFAHIGCGLPLRQTVAWVATAGGPACSHVTLHRKMRKAAPAFAALVRRLASSKEFASRESWGGYEVVALDGSVVVSPGPTGRGGRLHVALRLADLVVADAEVTTTDGGETLRRFEWAPGQLVVADRGYANPPGIAHVVRSGADVLIRVNRASLPLYGADGLKVDVLGWVRTLQGGAASERDVCVRAGDGGEVIGRMVAKRVPKDRLASARGRARREHGDDADALEMAEWVVLFTTATKQRMTASQIMETYRLRWQVELLFKRWKSLCNLDGLPNYRKDTLVTWLTGKLLLLMCAERMVDAARPAFSPLPNRESIARNIWLNIRTATMEGLVDAVARGRLSAAAVASA